jgi:formiminotetrahydrofolate cyclodeaminase
MERIGNWLDELASASPAPGGGAAAALSASIGASLICMVCNLTIGKPKYAAFEEQMSAALATAEDARRVALRLADDDARAFEAVIAATRLPRSTEAQTVARAEAIQQALAGAAAVPLRIAEIAVRVIGLAEQILEGANKNVLSDVAVAASAARAALESAMVNVEINLAAMTDEKARRAIADDLGHLGSALGRADEVVREVRMRIAG